MSESTIASNKVNEFADAQSPDQMLATIEQSINIGAYALAMDQASIIEKLEIFKQFDSDPLIQEVLGQLTYLDLKEFVDHTSIYASGEKLMCNFETWLNSRVIQNKLKGRIAFNHFEFITSTLADKTLTIDNLVKRYPTLMPFRAEIDQALINIDRKRSFLNISLSKHPILLTLTTHIREMSLQHSAYISMLELQLKNRGIKDINSVNHEEFIRTLEAEERRNRKNFALPPYFQALHKGPKPGYSVSNISDYIKYKAVVNYLGQLPDTITNLKASLNGHYLGDLLSPIVKEVTIFGGTLNDTAYGRLLQSLIIENNLHALPRAFVSNLFTIENISSSEIYDIMLNNHVEPEEVADYLNSPLELPREWKIKLILAARQL